MKSRTLNLKCIISTVLFYYLKLYKLQFNPNVNQNVLKTDNIYFLSYLFWKIFD